MELKLKKSEEFPKPKGPVVLLIMDGVGIGEDAPYNAVKMAETPHLDAYFQSPLYTQLQAHGTAVGMPTDEDMGNSEVGHNALGAGRVFDQGATLVQNKVRSGEIFNAKNWTKLIEKVTQNHTTLHFIGLLSDGNVHSHIDHLRAMITRASEDGVKRIRLHVLLDGRDVSGRSALGYLETIESLLKEASHKNDADYKIASGGGRMLMTMDRYNADWEMVKRGWDAHVLGQAPQYESAEQAVQDAYQNQDLNDQYLPPFVIAEEGVPVGTIEDGDAVVFFNFRGDRAIEISRAFEDSEFEPFDRVRVPDVFFVGMMEYDGDLHIPQNYLVDPPQIERSISEYLCAEGIRSFAISETQKYGHVTFFWNGNKSGYVDQSLETYTEIPSDNIPFDQQPAMKAVEITDQTIDYLESGNYDFGRVNFPNGDMVGHTGVFEAAKVSVEVTDQCVSRIVSCVKRLGGITVILADHGNADVMYTEKDGVKTPKTAHTLNPVPFVIIPPDEEVNLRLNVPQKAGLANVAATLINLLGYEAPAEYEPSLLAVSASTAFESQRL